MSVKNENHEPLAATGRVKLRVELGRQWISSRDVSRLRPGAVLELQNEACSDVSIVSGGQCRACGQLVDIQGVMGVRVTQVPGRTR